MLSFPANPHERFNIQIMFKIFRVRWSELRLTEGKHRPRGNTYQEEMPTEGKLMKAVQQLQKCSFL